MAAPRSPTQRRKRFLPNIAIDTNKPTHYITYKSALGWMARNQPVFLKALDLMRLYPTLKDHKYVESLRNFFSNYSNEQENDIGFEHYIGGQERWRFRRHIHGVPKSRKNSTEAQTDERGHLPKISVIPETPSPIHHERVRITVTGLPVSHHSKWGDLVLSLSIDSFIHCAQPGDLANVLETMDAIVFIITEYALQEKDCVKFLGLASSRDIPIVFVREPGFQLPGSGSFSRDTYNNKVVHSHERKGSPVLRSSSNPSLTDFPTLGKSGYYKHNGEHSPDPAFSAGYSLIVQRFKDSIVYSGTNADFCAQTITNDIREFLDKKDRTPSANSENNFSFDADDSSNSPDHLTVPSDQAPKDSAPEKDMPRGGGSNVPLFTQVDRRVSIDSETVYILFPVSYSGEGTGSPRYVRWPRRQSEDNLDDMDVSSISSELSVGFQDIDLSKPIYMDDITSDEEYNVHLQ